MADPAKHAPAEVRYQIELMKFHQVQKIFRIGGGGYQLDDKDDHVCLVKLIIQNQRITHQEVVGVVGEDFLNLVDFLNSGGVIGLHRDLVR